MPRALSSWSGDPATDPEQRRLLHHRCTLVAGGTVADADLVPPTAQNFGAVEVHIRRNRRQHARRPVGGEVDITLPGNQQNRGGAHPGHFQQFRSMAARRERVSAFAGLDDRLHPDVRGLAGQERGEREVKTLRSGDLPADVLDGFEHAGTNSVGSWSSPITPSVLYSASSSATAASTTCRGT
ncbi:hypothetical protein OH786_03975 [Streptomyces atratus]|uniref:hypothetical protein n=1 Tax=Streptomyces atratus TaxID=1893 RepID=UPI001161079D|nr:hypothetical protein [Streptomyces atratus]